MANILIVDDQPDICWALSKLARQMGHSAVTLTAAEDLFRQLGETPGDLVILDVRLPGMDGLEALRRLRQLRPRMPVIVITAYGDLEVAVQAMQAGAFEYLTKPFTLEAAAQAIRRALLTPTPGSVSPNAMEVAPENEPRLIGVSPAMQAVFKQIAVVAPTDSAVHITGESGTGKELVARAIHHYSPRRDRPFVVAHLAALSPSLVESELFGHVRGAFTGADSDHVGLLQRANGGTLFIDEVADIPLNVQAKLLRALEYREFCPVGGTKPVHIDFRLISATHQDLRRLVREGAFRHDLFYRLVTFEIHLPPLRERKEDIEPLAKYFMGRLAAQSGKTPPAWSPDFREALLSRPWWGNVRELRHALEHALIVSRGGVLHADHLPPALSRSQQDVAEEESLRDCVRKWVQQAVADPALEGRLYETFLQLVEPVLLEGALEIHRGQYIHAARHLGIHRVTLRKKLQQYRELRRFADRSAESPPEADPSE